MRKLAFIGAAGLLAAIAGCGGGGSDALSDREYVRSLEEICRSADSDLKDIQDPEDYKDISNASADAIDIVNKAIDDVNELKPPDDLKKDQEDFVAGLEDLAAGFDDLQAAADDEDDNAISDAGDTLAKASDDVSSVADDIGANDCVDVGNDSAGSSEETVPDDTTSPDTESPDDTQVIITVPPITASPETQPPATQPPATQPAATMPPIEMTMPPVTEPPVSGTSIETFDFDQLIVPAGYSWVNIEPAQLADIQSNFDTQFAGQIAAIGGAQVTDETNGFTFNAFVFFWNEEDIVATGTGINFLNLFTESAATSSDTFTPEGFPVTIWTDTDGAEGVGAIDADVSVVLYGPSGTSVQLQDFFDSFILAQG